MNQLVGFAQSPCYIVYGENDSKFIIPTGIDLKLNCNNGTATLKYLDKIILKQDNFTAESCFEIKLKKIGKFA